MPADLHDINENTLEIFGHVWVRQTIENLHRIARWPTVSALRGRFAGVPAFVVGAGPSLERNVAELRKAHARSVIIACSRALRTLEAADVIPDFVVVADSQDLSEHFAGYRWDDLTTLVLDGAVHRTSAEQPAKRYLYWPGCGQVDGWAFSAFPDGEAQVLAGGGSVSCSMLSMAAYWGCEPIVLVGQDLAYPDGQIYAGSDKRVDTAAGTYALRSVLGGPTVEQPLRELPGYNGGTVQTSEEYEILHRWYADTVPKMAAERTIYNATEGGAAIPGAEQLSLSTLVANYCTRTVFPSRVVAGVVDALDVPTRVTAMRGLLGLIRAALDATEERADHCARLALARDVEALGPAERELRAAAVPFVELMAALVRRQERKEVVEAVKNAVTLEDKLQAACGNYLLMGSTVRMVRPLFEAVDMEAA